MTAPRTTPAPPLAPAAAEALLEALAARRGVISAVGAGGKKSTLYRLLRAHQALDTGRVVLTTTVQTAQPPPDLAPLLLLPPDEPPEALVQATLRETPQLILAQRGAKPDRLAGLAPATIASLAAECACTAWLVKADGARMRLIKAPAESEPVLPPDVTTLLPIVSARVFGRPLDERIAHRLEQLCAVLGTPPGQPVMPELVARLLTSEQGALQGAGDAEVVPVITGVDTPPRRAEALAAAQAALAATSRFTRVVLADFAAAWPVIEVVTARQSRRT